MVDCNKYGKSNDNPNDIKQFCNILKANKVKDSKEMFKKFSKKTQCMFVESAWKVLSNKNKHSDESYFTSFQIFKLFRSKEMKELKIYERFNKLKSLDNLYKKANIWRKSKRGIETADSYKNTTTRSKKKYDKEFQRYPSPSSEIDPLYLYYISLYRENPKSYLAVTWLTEHGLLEGDERKKLVKKYKKLKDANKLIK
tara:strand:- start:268 stop:861 length:594 start_codon:yes stop_codon:yes gene_type:complete